MSSSISIVTPLHAGKSTCGYCGPPGVRSENETFVKTTDLLATQLSCQVYQDMINRGWRRSGTYCYKPDLKRSCCPQYTIRLDALQFKSSKSQRKLISRWNRFVLGEGDTENNVFSNYGNKSLKSGAPTERGQFSLTHSIHAAEYKPNATNKPAHKFQVTMEPSSYTLEKYALYERYQVEVHSDDNTTPEGFKRFLVQSPLTNTPIPYAPNSEGHLPVHYGSYHQMYRLDGVLIAMGVIDILPNCVSSVYFIYDPQWQGFSLGKLSALREASLVTELHANGAPDMNFLYMGFYIHSCQKMRYKADYSPSYLVDPETYSWYSLETCTPLLDQYRYASFAHPDHSLDTLENSEEIEPLFQFADDVLAKIHVIESVPGGQVTVVPLNISSYWRSKHYAILNYIEGMGMSLAQEVLLLF